MDESPLSKTLDTLSRFFVGRGSLDETLQWVSELATVAIPPVAMIGITMPSDGTGRTTVFTDPRSPAIDQAQYDAASGPCLDAMRHAQVTVVDSTLEPGPWSAFRQAAVEHGILSTMAVPLIVDDRVIGAMNLYSRSERAFGPEERAAAAAFADQAGVLLANSKLYWHAHELSERLNEAMETRAVIEQAKGILMGAQRCDAAEAFDLLRRASQRENIKLRDIARRIVERTTTNDGAGMPPDLEADLEADA